MTEWSLEGVAFGETVREGMPDKVYDLHSATAYAVFTDGETILLQPTEEIEP